MLSTFLLIVVIILVILFLRSVSEKTITMPPDVGGSFSPVPGEVPGAPDFKAMEGVVDGEPYTADVYEDAGVTVSIDTDEPFDHDREVDAREGRPEIKADDPFRAELEELLSLGADLIELMGETSWISASFPRRITVDAALAEKTARLLVRIKRKIV